MKHWDIIDWAFLALILMLLLSMCTGCAGMRVELEHTSHPFAGPPFGDRSEEDSLNTLNVVKSYQKGRFYTDVALGKKIGNGGFYGPDLTATVRVGISLEPSK